ncbi:DnaT-like ssDNA-binding domain-containing protein [Cronobacter malonaticus]|uniref:DnaT-like ssDNA-binding domain-containing protein n=1 Tax=Cronobacter TaxID=413496 RepID=UPI001EED8ECC|nr:MULTISPECIES: DnaT-like ssDNA-binding domain-containing protein [Cronobacter]
MTDDWQPSPDFRQRAATWGVILPEPGYLPAELASFRDYWISEGRVFTQIQWEQKFARSLQHRPPARPGKTVNDAQVPHWNSPEGWENFI